LLSMVVAVASIVGLPLHQYNWFLTLQQLKSYYCLYKRVLWVFYSSLSCLRQIVVLNRDGVGSLSKEANKF
jgi:hypothetical protein